MDSHTWGGELGLPGLLDEVNAGLTALLLLCAGGRTHRMPVGEAALLQDALGKDPLRDQQAIRIRAGLTGYLQKNKR
jgi:hypothetical protein